MKRLFVFLCATALFSTFSFAQYQVKDGMNKAKTQQGSYNGGRTINTLSFSVNPMSCTWKASDDGLSVSDSDSFLGFSLKWNGSIDLSNTQLRFGYGAGLQYAYSSKPENWGVDKVRFLSAKIPLELQYAFDFSGSNVSLVPYAGFDAVIHFMGKEVLGDTSYNMFEDSDLRRFNIDWHVGAKLYIDRFFFGAAYEGPVLKLYSENPMSVGMSQADIFVGFVF